MKRCLVLASLAIAACRPTSVLVTVVFDAGVDQLSFTGVLDGGATLFANQVLPRAPAGDLASPQTLRLLLSDATNHQTLFVGVVGFLDGGAVAAGQSSVVAQAGAEEPLTVSLEGADAGEVLDGGCICLPRKADSCVGTVCRCGNGPACGKGQVCDTTLTPAQCVCVPYLCPGCCTATQICQDGNTSLACGNGGSECATCAQSCDGGVCQGFDCASCTSNGKCCSGSSCLGFPSCPAGSAATACQSCNPKTANQCGPLGCQCGSLGACILGLTCDNGRCL